MFTVKEVIAKAEQSTIIPTMIQNNIPAFALFAMFFIVIPLSGSLITEKTGGTYNRLRTLPVSLFILLAGKIVKYLVVCLVQLGLMILVGILILPLFGTPVLEMGSNYGAMFMAAISSALATVGFGLLIGTLFGTQGQAAMFGSTMVVILGAMGGVMVPVFLMPGPLENISRIFSPIRWGIDVFVDIFVREGDVRRI